MSKQFRTRIAVAALVVASVGLAHGQLTPSDDTYVSTAAPATNYGAATSIAVQNPAATGLIRFDLSSIPSTYKSANVTKATLKLYVSAVTTAGNFNVVRVTSQWAEKTVNHNTKPTLGTAVASNVAVALAAKNQYIQIDVTAAVGEWLNGTNPNYGVALVPGTGASFTVNSKETTTTSHAPELDIVFTGAAGPAGPAGPPGPVSSVGLSAPTSDFVVAGSPVTKAGTLGLSWKVVPDSNNTANAIVKRDVSGSFSANSIVANSLIASTTDATTANAADINISGGVLVSTGRLVGIDASSSAADATTIFAKATAATGAGWGVQGSTASNAANAKGVYGFASATTGTAEGLSGISLSNRGLGVAGIAAGSSFSTQAAGQIGNFPIGVVGDASAGVGVLATSDTSVALLAISNSPFSYAAEIHNVGGSPFFAGGNIGSVTINGNGDLTATGAINGAVKNFRIDHPLDPGGKYLNHTSIESSEMLNLYTGNAILGADGSATVALPTWFTALNEDFRYQLTPIGGFAQLFIAEEISGNQFRIAGGRNGMKVSWQVTGVRHDGYSKKHPLVVESEKQGEELGHFQNPEAFGQPLEMGITAVRRSKSQGLRAASAPVGITRKAPFAKK